MGDGDKDRGEIIGTWWIGKTRGLDGMKKCEDGMGIIHFTVSLSTTECSLPICLTISSASVSKWKDIRRRFSLCSSTVTVVFSHQTA